MQGIMQACWRNEKNQVIARISKEWHVQKWFFCSKCLRIFDTIHEAQQHYTTCNLAFNNIIFRKGNLSIARVTSNSPDAERAVCEQASHTERIESKWEKPVIRKDNWSTRQFTSKCFVLFKNSEFVALTIIRDGLFPHESGQIQRQKDVASFFTLCNHRKQGYAKMLLFQALDSLGENCGSVRFLGNFSQSGRQFILSLKKSLDLKTIKTVPIELSSLFDE